VRHGVQRGAHRREDHGQPHPQERRGADGRASGV
jgi:hypothetical protein